MEISKYFNEKGLVNIIALNPEIITKNEALITKEYSINGGRIDLLFADNINRNHFIIVEVKTDASKIRTAVGQLIEYKEKFLQTLENKKLAKIECVVCAPNSISYELPDEMKYIDLSKNIIFVNEVNKIICSKLDIISETLNSPINLNLELKKEEMKVKKVDTLTILNLLKKIPLKGKPKGEIVSFLSKNIGIGVNKAGNKLNEIERKGYIKYTRGILEKRRITVSFTKDGAQYKPE